jgi:hypothetical protein
VTATLIPVRRLRVVTMNNEKPAARLAKPNAVPFGLLQAAGALLFFLVFYFTLVFVLRYGFDVRIWSPL